MARSSQLEAVKAEWGENEKSFAGIISCPGLGQGGATGGRESEKLKPCVAPSVTHQPRRQKLGWQKRNLQRGLSHHTVNTGSWLKWPICDRAAIISCYPHFISGTGANERMLIML